jgi:hypothetical protein
MSSADLRQRQSRCVASRAGSRSPATMARMIAMPVLPVTSVTARWICTFIWSSAFCIHCTQRARSSTRFASWRCMALRATIASPGRKDPRSKPQLCSNWIHWQSWKSVLRPGTLCNCRALTRTTCRPRDSSSSYSGIQYTDVLSMATDSTFCSTNQSTSSFSCPVVVRKTRTFGGPSARTGPQTQCCVLPTSMPATIGRMTGREPGSLRFFFSLDSLCLLTYPPPVRQGLRPEVAICGDSDLGECVRPNSRKPHQ